MLYPTLSQPLIVLCLLGGGILGGLIFDVFRLLTLLSGNDRYSKHIFDFLSTLCCFALLFILNLTLNFGQFRLYVLVVFLLTFALERLISKILWTKLLKKWYSSIAQRRNKTGKRKKEETA